MPPSPVILVSGASSGIGAATARLFAQKGFRVVLAARRMERLQALAQEIEAAGGHAFPVRTDLSSLPEIQNLVQTTIDRFGQIDILFNNAGFGRLDWLENLDAEADVQTQVQVDVLGVIWLAQAVLPHMIARQQGHIINMASVAALVATPTYSIYSACKFAVRGFNEALRREVGIYGVKVSMICPGGVATEFAEIAGIHRTTKITTPKWLTLSAEDVAQAVWRLARRPRKIVIIPWLLHFASWSNALFPGLLDWMIELIFVRPERRKQNK